MNKININFKDTPKTTQKCVHCGQTLSVKPEPFKAKIGTNVLIVYGETLYCDNEKCNAYHCAQIYMDLF